MSKANKKRKSDRPTSVSADPSGGADGVVIESLPEQDAEPSVAAASDQVGGDVNALLLERAALDQRLVRLQADFENFRKRTQRERTELSQRATQSLMEELLTVLDHFELGFENAEKHEANPAVVEGFRLVYDQAIKALGKFGLNALEAHGKTFDPHYHEAITQMPSEDHPADTVIMQTRRGYLLGDRLIRAAQVVVSSGPAGDGIELPDEDRGSLS